MNKSIEEKKERIKPIVLVPEVESTGVTVFRCLNEEDRNLVNRALISPKGVKVKTAKGRTCPIDGEDYEKSACKKLDDLFEKEKKGKEEE